MAGFTDNGYSLGQFIRKMPRFTDSRVIRQDAIHKNERIYGWGSPTSNLMFV